ncbi:hypothetical protein D3C81_1520680 [compost metagenome]
MAPAESIQKIAKIVYGNTGDPQKNAQKIINANKGKPDGNGGKFDQYLSRLYPGQKIRIPAPISMGKYLDFKADYLK